jgi:hypothetical protein
MCFSSCWGEIQFNYMGFICLNWGFCYFFYHQVVAFLCGYIHYNSQSSSSKKHPSIQPWNIM